MYFAHGPKIITLKLYELLPAFIISIKPCTKGCNSCGLYHISLFIFVKCTEQHQYHNINYIFEHKAHALEL
jgi:hypothetical protein